MAANALSYSPEPEPQDAPERSVADEERLKEAMRAIVSAKEKEAEDRVAKRQLVEKRWLEDLRNLAGEYDSKTIADLTAAKKSKLFINQTRTKTNSAEARLSDMLFPTDDKNWAISPTPVPELTEQAKAAIEQAKQMVGRANDAKDAGNPAAGVQIAQAAQGKANEAAEAKKIMDEAVKRADAMEKEINDQLVECGYAIQARDVIRDACRLGTGIMKGPVGATDRVRRSWQKQMGPDGTEQHQLEVIEDPRPAYYRVDPWGFFPDPDAKNCEESESFFERHLWTRKDLRKLAKQPGFDPEAIRTLLKDEPSKAMPQYVSQVRGIISEQSAPQDTRYIGWEYRGPLTAEDLRTICHCLGDEKSKQYAEVYAGDEIDPLTEICVAIHFCQGELLKFSVHYLDSNEPIYSVYNLEKDDASVWGFGIPYIMRNSQAAMNGAWRMMMDNAGLSSRPQIEIDQNVIEPADGNDWTLTAGKVWLRKPSTSPQAPGFKTYEITSHQPELAGIIELSKQFIDDETNMSILAQGEQGTHTTKTSSGMALLMNAVNVVFRRMVKNFDDDMTVPNIRRLYDWNMQFSEKEHIKGDFAIDARGSSALLVREIQSQNLMVLSNMTAHPVLGMLLKAAPIMRKTAQSMMLAADEVVKTDDEIAEEVAAMKNQPQPTDPRIEAQLKIAQSRDNTALQIAQLNRDTAMLKLAHESNMSLEQIRAQLLGKQMDHDSKERILSAEIAVEARQAASAPDGEQGSGGYIA